MEPGKGALEEALAAIESETRHLVHAEARSTSTAETDVDIAPLVHEVGATSIAEIEKLIAELQEARDFLQSEGERVRRETERYTNLTQTASASVKIISDTVAGWREAGHPLRNQTGIGRVRGHALPGRGRHRFAARAGRGIATTTGTSPRSDPREGTS
jgi:prophage DNA circulation protein